MQYEQLEWRSGDGARLFACGWKPEAGTQVKAVIGIVHGMGEHSGRYDHVSERLTSEGCAVLTFDQRGHGRTEGQRGHTPSYEALLDSVDLLLAEARRKYPDLPLFLFGHSMGGNVTLNYLLRRNPAVAGAIVTGPWLKLAFDPPTLPYMIGRIMERIYPRFSNNRPLQPLHLTSDPEMMKRIMDDPLGHGSITPKFFFGVHRAGKWAIEHAAELTVPLLLMHGGDDKVTSIEASRLFAERAGDRCTFEEWPGMRHELHNERERDAVFARMIDWIDGRIKR